MVVEGGVIAVVVDGEGKSTVMACGGLISVEGGPSLLPPPPLHAVLVEEIGRSGVVVHGGGWLELKEGSYLAFSLSFSWSVELYG